MNVGSLLPRHARFRPDHTALVVGDQRLSYRQLNSYVNRLANALLAAGLAKGDKLATCSLTNCVARSGAMSWPGRCWNWAAWITRAYCTWRDRKCCIAMTWDCGWRGISI